MHPAVFVLALAAIHGVAGWLPPLTWLPRSRWLSFAGGVAVAYVFAHVLPGLDRAHEPLRAVVSWTSHPAHLVALGGLVAMYAVERGVRRRERRGRQTGAKDATFWLHIATFCLYNAVVGHLLGRGEPRDPGLFTLALGFHFLVNDYTFQRDHRAAYDRVGRWLLAAAVIVGGVTGAIIDLGPAWTHLLFAFLAGAIVLNVLKEELPADREARLSAFFVGVVVFTALVLIVEAQGPTGPPRP